MKAHGGNKGILEAHGIVKNFPHDGVDQDVLHGIDLVVQRGEFVAIMGPSGCGKSTFLHILGLMLSATRATGLTIDGIDTLPLNASKRTKIRREKIGFVFQRFNLLDVLTARDNLRLALKLRGQAVDGRVDEFLERVGLDHKGTSKPCQMSIGEQQRLALARAVIHRPVLLLADEPTGNLDSDNAERVMDLLGIMHHEFDQTTIMVTHNSDLASRADRVITMKDGRIIE